MSSFHVLKANISDAQPISKGKILKKRLISLTQAVWKNSAPLADASLAEVCCVRNLSFLIQQIVWSFEGYPPA
jgi:hypothetical protein